MDWPKIKSIFIVLLLIVDCVLGGYYFYDVKSEKDAIAKSIENTVKFIAEEGITVECGVPSERPKLRLLSVTLQEGDPAELYFQDGKYKVEIIGCDGLTAEIESEGGTQKQVDTASKGLIKFYQSLSSEDKNAGCTVYDIELVYLIELDETASTGQKDTATPSWKISSSLGIYYFNAYTE